MDISFRPKSGRFGLVPVVTAYNLPSTPMTANTTVTHRLPSPPGKSFPIRATLQCSTLGADADGTMLARLIRRRASDDQDVTISGDVNMETMTVGEKTYFTMSGTDAQRTMLSADTLELDLVSNSAAIDTQPVNVVCVVEFAVLE